VFPRNLKVQAVVLAVVAVVAVSATQADDVAKKWRVSVGLGGTNSDDEIQSAAANEMFTLDPCIRTLSCPEEAEAVVRAFRDPRNDSAVFGSLDINPGTIGTIAVQYGLGKMFLLEGSVGYQKSDLGDIEVSAQLPGNPSQDTNIIPFNFVVDRIEVGELELVPIQVSAMARFRPRATFNPYVGVGVGYILVGYEASNEFNSISYNMDRSLGRQLRLTPFYAQTGASDEGLYGDGLPQVDLEGASVDAGDTFAWHLVGGAELTVKKRWSVFLDLRWVDASRSIDIGFNNSVELGTSVPSFSPYDDSPTASIRYGPNEVGACVKVPEGIVDPVTGQTSYVSCAGGGLIDFGHVVLVPSATAAPTTDCTQASDIATPQCVFDFVFNSNYPEYGGTAEPDGIPDPGQYYAVGGKIDYDGYTLTIGARYTFGK
jgi:opacity protein-like surface antigen